MAKTFIQHIREEAMKPFVPCHSENGEQTLKIKQDEITARIAREKEEDRAMRAAPYVVWVDHGYEGWSPTPYNTLNEAIAHHSYGSNKIITRRCDYKVVDVSDEKQCVQSEVEFK